MTWDITAQGVTLFLTLPNPAASTRYCMGTHWCVPMPYPTINTISTEVSDYPDELDDYRPRLDRTSESDVDNGIVPRSPAVSVIVEAFSGSQIWRISNVNVRIYGGP